MHDDEKFDEFLRGAAKDYKASSDAHAGDIWAAIAPDVAKAINPQRRFPASLRTATWVGIGIAATLMIGVGVGRWSNRPDAQQQQQHVAVQHPAPVNDDSSAHVAHVRATAIEHLADAEVFLTTVRADMKAGRTEADRAERSRELLARTRLLLGSTSNATPNVKRLLEDLELLLAEIAAMPPSHSSMDKTLLDESMREGNIIPRIRATLPAQQAGS